MTDLLTAAQMRAIEDAAIDSGKATGLDLMDRAGRGVVDAILDWRPELATSPHRAVILCGPGNNGGDGFVVARLLKHRGWEVEVLLYGDAAKLPPDASTNATLWREIGAIVPLKRGALANAAERHHDMSRPGVATHRTGTPRIGPPGTDQQTIFVDALFGTGLNRPLPEDLCDTLAREWTDHCRENGIAIDFPTGICSDSGQSLGSSPLRASLVVTFQQEKRGHRLGVWNEDCMALVTVDLGIDGDHPGRCVLVARGQGALDGRHDQWRGKLSSTNKYHSGHALVISGGVGKGGAARLVARGALRIGAGLVTVGCPPDAMVENAARLDAIMVRSIADAEELTVALDDTRLNALCLGPGQGVGHTTREMVAVALAARRKTVLDADALSSFAGTPEELFERTHDACVLTPHEGEFGRLFPDLLARLREPAVTGPAYSKVDATREAAARAGCVVLFKGADTVIADPDGRCAINSAHYERAAPWLATAGSGDVLAGFITGLLARGFGPMAAAEAAAWLHVECALTFGPGLIAEDLPEQLPAVFRDLGL